MGYLQNMLPKYMARLGVDVHVVTTDLPPYYQTKDFQETYGEFTAKNGLCSGTIEQHDGYLLHVLAPRRLLGQIRMVGLHRKLKSIQPDIVQTMANFGWIALDAALAKPTLGYKLFTGNHFHSSVFPLSPAKHSPANEFLKNLVWRKSPGWLVSLSTEKCYAITDDCAEVAVRYLGVPRRKITVCSLGVDTDLFYPVSQGESLEIRNKLRCELGFQDDDIVCIYTGRFSADKNPLLLAKAVESLSKNGKPFRGLFV